MGSIRWYSILGLSPLKTRSFISTPHVRFLKSFENDVIRLKEISPVPFRDSTESNDTSIANPLNLRKMVISNFIYAHNEAKPEEWSSLKEEISQLPKDDLDDANIDFAILNRCFESRKKLPLARSYLNYMRHSKKKIDGAVACEFLKLCYSRRTLLEKEDSERIISFTNFLQKKYTNYIDSYVGEGLIKGFILQNKIDDCFRTLSEIKKWDQANEKIYFAIITYLIENGRSEDLKNLMLEFTAQYPLRKKLCSIWIENFSGSRIQLDELLTTFRRLSYLPEKYICDDLLRSYESLPGPQKLHGQYGTVSDKGLCSVCGEYLNRIHVSDDEFERLKKSFLNNVLVGSDVYTHTKPYELEKFHTLMNLHGPFGIVIDGLNVGYYLGSSGQPSSYVQGIEKVLAKLRQWKPRDKIMFIGKWHMRKWPGLLDMIRHFDSRYFFVENDSVDDMYIISAALHSGAFIVSNDALGKEKLRLNREEFNLFERWRQSSVISIRKRFDEGIELSFPFPFEKVVQSTKSGGWHIPYNLQTDRSHSSEVFKNWLCLRPSESI